MANGIPLPAFVQDSLLAVFPNIEKILRVKVREGFRLKGISYEADVSAARETIKVVLTKGYENYELTQSRDRSGRCSHPEFRKDGEPGEIILDIFL